MILSSLNFQDFRNFRKKKLKFSSHVAIIVGPNTSGKTNILEAIYMLVTGKSFRANLEREVISYGEEMARVNAEVVQEEGIARFARLSQESNTLEIMITKGQVAGKKAPKKRFLVNKVERRLADFVGNFQAVLFRPEDLLIVTDSPTLRRDYLDNVLSSVDKEYRRASLLYGKALRQRNKVLERIRERGVSLSRLEYWDKLLIKNGKIISQKREKFIEFVNQQFGTTNKRPRPSYAKEFFKALKMVYRKNEVSQERLKRKRKTEIQMGMTVVGPHRDDFVVSFEARGSRFEGERDLSIYGSRGEQRLAILWLKFGELAFLEEKTGEKPILLLDDIFSELDKRHRSLVSQIIPNQQTIITTTEEELIKNQFLKDAEFIRLTI